MAAYGAATSLKNTIQRILQSSRISLVPPPPPPSRISRFARFYCAVFDSSIFKWGMLAYGVTVYLKKKIGLTYYAVFDKSYFQWAMAAYVAAVSLKIMIIRRIPHSSPQMLQTIFDEMCHLQKTLLKLDDTSYSKMRAKVNALDDRIKQAVWEFEDLLESHLYDQIRGGSDHLSFSVDLQTLRPSARYFVKRVMMMEVEYYIELMDLPEEEGEPVSSRIDVGGINSKMVGLSSEFEQVRDYLLAENEGNSIAVVGMAGVGKTTLAKKVFDDPLIQRYFELRAWVKVGRQCELSETLRCILAQVDPSTHDQMLTQGDDDINEKLVGLLEERLEDKKCLVVLDDVWGWYIELMEKLPEENVRILLTSRLNIEESPNQIVRLLDEEESKKLLGERVFGEEGFPFHLEKLGEKIAKKCEGLPLMIVTVAELLSEEEKTPEYWTEIVQKQHNSVFVDAYDQISKVLFPSYDYLPQILKMVFLYLGAFPPYCDITAHNLFHQLSAEGFIEPTGEETLGDFTLKCLRILSSWYHLVLDKSKPGYCISTEGFHVHSCWQHLCKKEATKIKFLHVLQSCDDFLKDQRRLCTHSNTLFAFEQVYDSINSDCASTLRSLLCLGPYHQYPLPIHAIDFKLLKVLDAIMVRFYHVPIEILKLVCIEYLSLTCNKELPASISNLFNLQSLIIGKHMNIKKRGGHSYMPVEIWDMQELQHIEVRGRDLPTPISNTTLDKLSCLFGVSPKSCTREILKRVPNLKSLEIWVELKPYDDDNDSNPLSNLDYISELQNLELLAYGIVNPEIKYASMVPLSMFPSSLTRLYMGGLGCPWKHLNDIGSLLPNLIVLKLEKYAFRGPEWNVESGCFLKLDTLQIGDTDLVRWKVQHGSLLRLDLLNLRHCYKLQQLDWMPDPSMVTTATIELVDCNPVVVAFAMQLPESLFTVSCSLSYL